MSEGPDIPRESVRVPASDPGRAYSVDRLEIESALSRVLNSGWFIQGEECRTLEQAFASYLGVRGAIGVSSGTDAIELAVRCLGIGPGDEVILPALTSSATATAVVRAGATPVFADIEAAAFGLDPASAESMISARTKAILPVHLYGHPCDLDRLSVLCRAHGLGMIEDCAQAHGAEWGGRKVGGYGAVAAFSFYPTKNLAALGDGGALVSDDPAYLDRASVIRQYGWRERQVSDEVGMNSRMDEIQAAVLRVRLEKLGNRNARRREIADRYHRALARTPLILPTAHAKALPVYHQYVVRSTERDALRSHLLRSGIQSQVLYPVPLHAQAAFAECPRAHDLSASVQATRELFCLPIHPELTDCQVDGVVDATLRFFTKS